MWSSSKFLILKETKLELFTIKESKFVSIDIVVCYFYLQ